LIYDMKETEEVVVLQVLRGSRCRDRLLPGPFRPSPSPSRDWRIRSRTAYDGS